MIPDTFTPRYDISVIIPAESHRGQAVDCIRGWTQEQDYPADRYQIIICAPNTLESATEAEIRELLRPWDRFDKYPFEHDMPLVAEGAHLAESALLFFTESHCLPNGTAISSIFAEANNHPEWSGFSCKTTPLTHNMLSEIEAEMYDTHIRNELESGGWLKVLDQCFLVHREAYFGAGGFRPSFGHFAEWLLAAEMHRLGKIIGFCTESIIKHYYIGEIKELEKFTIDFAKGQIKYLAECSDEPTSTYFSPIPELTAYKQRSQEDYRKVAKAKTVALRATFIGILKSYKNKKPCALISAVLLDWIGSILKIFGISASYKLALLDTIWTKYRLKYKLHVQTQDEAKTEFLDWFGKLVHLGRIQYLLENPSLINSFIRTPNYSIAENLNFHVSTQSSNAVEWLGFFDKEEANGLAFRWSEPTANVWLPLHEGDYQVVIEWHKVRPLAPFELLSISFDNQPIPYTLINLEANKLVIQISSKAKNPYKLSWSVLPFQANNDKRLLGLPISKINWFSVNQKLVNKDLNDTPPLINSVYFLHIPKCAGTSIRILMDNAYNSSAIMAPYAGMYYLNDLQDIRSMQAKDFYRGHFYWNLPARLPDIDWNIVTILRDPVDRILSKFYYMKQYGFIHKGLSFVDWFEHQMTLADTITMNFLSINGRIFRTGADNVRQESLALISDAQANLNKCLAVGLFERIEDSVNLLAWHLGFLAPQILPVNNPTHVRISSQEISNSLRIRIEEVLETDMALYYQAQQQFQKGMAAMLDTANQSLVDTSNISTIRTWLRQRYFDSIVNRDKLPSAPKDINWTPDDVFHGDNLQARELYQGNCLRWTGQKAATHFHFFLGVPRLITMSIMLCAVTPHEHASSAILSVNDFNIPLQISNLPSGEILITAQITKEILEKSRNAMTNFILTTPVRRGNAEFRMLGVALKSIILKST